MLDFNFEKKYAKKLPNIFYGCYFDTVLKTRQEHGEVSIALIADQQQSKVQDALPSIYS